MPWKQKIRVVIVPIKRRLKKYLKIPTEISTPTIVYFKIKRQKVLTGIGCEWYLNSMRKNKSPTKNLRLNKK